MSHRGMVGLAGYDGLGLEKTFCADVPVGAKLAAGALTIPLSAGICAGLAAMVGLAFGKAGKFAKYGALGGLALGAGTLAWNWNTLGCAKVTTT